MTAVHHEGTGGARKRGSTEGEAVVTCKDCDHWSDDEGLCPRCVDAHPLRDPLVTDPCPGLSIRGVKIHAAREC